MSHLDPHIKKFLNLGFDENFTRPIQHLPTDVARSQRILDCVRSNVGASSRPRKYVLGLALDFIMLAQRLSNVDAEGKSARSLSEAELFARYRLITERGNVTANTLSLGYGGVNEGIRKLEERVIELFAGLNRSGYPSAYVYNTGQWQKYKDLLLDCFNLSENGRYSACLSLIGYATTVLPEQEFFGRPTQRIRLFETVIEDLPRSAAGENGGAMLQGIVHGFIAADRPHLSIIADKARTGSARQKRFGDIDCYSGLDIELSVEVKDMPLASEDYSRQLESFVSKVESNGVMGMVVAQQYDASTKELLAEKGIFALTVSDLLQTVRTWDWVKQNNGLLGLLHHVSHIEQSVPATQRLLNFIRESDPEHDSLIYTARMTQQTEEQAEA